MGLNTILYPLAKGIIKVANSRAARSVGHTIDDLANDATVQAIKTRPKASAALAADTALTGVGINKVTSNKIKEDKKAIEEAEETQNRIKKEQERIDQEREAQEKAKSKANIKAAKERGPTTVKTTRPHPAAYDQRVAVPSGTVYKTPKTATDYHSDVTDRISKEIDEL